MGETLSSFLQSFVIFLREGAEAALLIAALWVALTAMHAPPRAYHALLGGAGAGIAASVAGGLALYGLAGALAETQAELLEGVALLLAAVVLLTVSSWLLGQRQAHQWREKLQHKTQQALSRGGLLALVAVGFLAVFREGVETVLFLAAALAGQNTGIATVIAGAGLALLAIAGAFIAVRTAGMHLPLRQFFTITAWALLALAVIYAGKGIHELQEVGLLTQTVLNGWPRLAALGIYPTLQTILAQFLAIMAGLALNTRARRGARTHAAE